MNRTTRTDAGPLEIELRIDRLVVDGALLDDVNPRAVRAAVQNELLQLLAGVSAPSFSAAKLEHVRVADVHLPRPIAAAALGTHISGAVGSALSPQASIALPRK